ncbi:MAG: hypothetical protein JXB88_24250 [Spirochaetales bacterium]|nr:hypothetical protein [Spirochaetales bacterium]
MKKRTCLKGLILCFVLITVYPWNSSSWEATVKKDILIIPFTNKCGYEYDYLSEFISHAIFTLLKDVPEYTCISPIKLYEFMKERDYNSPDLDDPNIYFNAAKYFKSKIVIRGEYYEEDGDMYVCFEAIHVNDTEKFFSREFHFKKDMEIIKRLEKCIFEFICMFTGIKLEYGVLKVTAHYPCILYVDNENLGETPGRVQLLAGKHTLRLDYKEGNEINTVHNTVVDIQNEKETPVSSRVFIPVVVDAELECLLFINNEYAGVTPYKGLLFSGREYKVKAIYTDASKKEYYVQEEKISTISERDITLYVPVKGKINVVNQKKNLKASLNKGQLQEIPCSFEDLIPGQYKLSFILFDNLYNKKFILKKELIKIKPQDTVKIDAGMIEFQNAWGLLFIPSASQYYNREPLKGTILLSSFLASLLGTVTCYALVEFVFKPIVENKNAPYEEAIRARDNAIMTEKFFYRGIALTALIGICSAIDGGITMNRIRSLLSE